jgi:hypothetical protein
MPTRMRGLGLGIAVFAAMSCAAGCGGNSGTSTGSGGGDVVARVGDTPITQAAVNHWMTTLAGGTFYELSGRATLPAGLVSEPPDYPACVSHLEAVASAVPAKLPKPSAIQLLRKCRDLHEAVKLQAVAFLVNVNWITAAYREAGVTASDAEVLQSYKRWRSEHGLASDVALGRYLGSLRRSPSDEQVVLKLDLLYSKAQEKLDKGGKQAAAKFAAAEQRWTSGTSCQPGYVVLHCKQYEELTSASASPPPVAALMQQVAALETGRCIDKAVCGRQ